MQCRQIVGGSGWERQRRMAKRRRNPQPFRTLLTLFHDQSKVVKVSTNKRGYFRHMGAKSNAVKGEDNVHATSPSLMCNQCLCLLSKYMIELCIVVATYLKRPWSLRGGHSTMHQYFCIKHKQREPTSRWSIVRCFTSLLGVIIMSSSTMEMY